MILFAESIVDAMSGSPFFEREIWGCLNFADNYHNGLRGKYLYLGLSIDQILTSKSLWRAMSRGQASLPRSIYSS